MRLYSVTAPQVVFNIIKEQFVPLEGEPAELQEAGGRIVAQDVLAREDVPGFDRSTVDGYAVRAADTFGAGETLPAMLELVGEVRMGEAALSLARGKTIYVPTGGMLPPGADAVVMIEDTESMGNLLNCHRQVAPGENVIRRGEDIAQGVVVVKKGRRLRAPELGLLASLGITSLMVIRRPRVGIISTGDEIVPAGTKELRPGQIRDSNSVAVAEIVRRKGGIINYGGIIRDTYADFRNAAESLLAQVDFLVLSGGSSVGTRDYTSQVLEEMSDTELLVEGVAIQPGKPTLLTRCQGKPVLGLPGHPVSALNVFSLFGTALLDRLQGIEEDFQPVLKAVLSRNVPSRIGRTDYVRVRLERKDDAVEAIPVFGRSGLLRTLADARGIIIIPPGMEGLPEGSTVDVVLWD